MPSCAMTLAKFYQSKLRLCAGGVCLTWHFHERGELVVGALHRAWVRRIRAVEVPPSTCVQLELALHYQPHML